jgi:hypothetical protein
VSPVTEAAEGRSLDGSDVDAAEREGQRTLRRTLLVGWLVSVACWSVYLIVAADRSFQWDAGQYWFLSIEGGPAFDPSSFGSDLRAYAYPWLLRVWTEVTSPISDDAGVVVRLGSLALVPLLLSVLVPMIGRSLRPDLPVTVQRILVLNALFFAFWRQDLLFPLTDIPALVAVSVGVLLTLRVPTLPGALGAGVAFGMGFVMRPSYVLAVAAAIALIFLVELVPRRLVLRMLVMVAGVSLALAPQVASNVRAFDSWSPATITSSSLFEYQLYMGLRMQRYDTYTGVPAEGFTGQMVYEDRSLREELAGTGSMGPLGQHLSPSSYLEIVRRRPAEVTSLYARHALNGLDPRFGGTYVDRLDGHSPLVPLLNYVVVAIAVLGMAIRWRRRGSTTWRGPVTWFSAVLLASCLTAVTSAVEVRFMLPLHLTLLAAFAFGTSREDLPTTPRGRLVSAVVLVVVVVGWSLVTEATLDSLSPALS